MGFDVRLIALASVFLCACSLQPSDLARVNIAFSAQSRPAIDWAAFLGPERRLLQAPLAPIYACVGVNVVGPGVPALRSGDDIEARLQGLYQGSACTYQGVFQGFYSTTGSSSVSFDLNVPTGPDRIIQVGGADQLGGMCDAGGEQEQDIFEWGRARLGIFGGATVSISEHPGTTYRNPAMKMNCGDNLGVPGQFPGLMVWHQSEGADQCSGGGSTVSVIAKRAGAFSDFTPAIANQKPTCHTNTLNGYSRLDFTGSPETKMLATLASPPAVIDGMTFFLVGKLYGMDPVFTLKNSSSTAYFSLRVVSGPSLSLEVKPNSATSPEALAVAGFSGGDYRIYTLVWDRLAAMKLQAQVDASGAVAQQSSTAASTLSAPFESGTPFELYLFGDAIMSSNGSWVEMIGYSTALSSADRATMIDWLRNKYGMPLP